MEKLLNEYKEKFNDNFPIFLCRSMEEEEIIEIMQKCIDEGKPYEPELEEEANY